jgi:hypothetical protein
MMKWRRYRDEDGARHTTLEVPEEVISYLGPKRLAIALERAERAAAARTRMAKVKAELARGDKPEAVAHEHQLSPRYVRQLKQEMRES